MWERVSPTLFKSLVNRVRPLGVSGLIAAWNAAHGTEYEIRSLAYPATTGGYPWANYPYDYWRLWVLHTDGNRDRGEFNLDDLARDYDVIVFKHCFPVGRIATDEALPSASSEARP